MTDLEKPKRKPRAKKPPTQIAGVSGIDGHGGMGEAPIEPPQHYIDWKRLVGLPAFEMFVFDESGANDHASINNWVENRRASMGDGKLYQLYEDWHTRKGLWVNETPLGKELKP